MYKGGRAAGGCGRFQLVVRPSALSLSVSSVRAVEYADIMAGLGAIRARLSSDSPVPEVCQIIHAVLDKWQAKAAALLLSDPSLLLLLECCAPDSSPFVEQVLLVAARLIDCQSGALPCDLVLARLGDYLVRTIDCHPRATFLMTLACGSLHKLPTISYAATIPSIIFVLQVHGDCQPGARDLICLSDCDAATSLVCSLGLIIVDWFEGYLCLVSAGDHVEVVFAHLWGLATSCCYELFVRAVAALLRVADRHPRVFTQRFSLANIAGELAARLRVLGDGPGSRLLLLLFAQLTRLNSAAENALLLVNRNLLPRTVMRFLDCDVTAFYLPCCRIVGNLVRSVKRFASAAMKNNMICPFLDVYDTDMELLCKLAAASLFADSVVRLRRTTLPIFLDYRQIIADWPDFLEVAGDKDVPVLLDCLLRLVDVEPAVAVVLIDSGIVDTLDRLPERLEEHCPDVLDKVRDCFAEFAHDEG
jgi:hypothetical protein